MFLLKSLRNNEFFRNNLKFIIYFLPITFFFIILFWPYLWHAIINNFLFGFSQLLSANFFVNSLYMGKFILSQNVPWHYPIVWIGITSPVIVILLFLFGLFFLIRRIITRLIIIDENSKDIWRGDNEMIDIYFLLMVFMNVLLYLRQRFLAFQLLELSIVIRILEILISQFLQTMIP